MTRIGKRLLDSTQTQEERRVFWDDMLKGFGVILRPSGVHSFVFSYRNAKNRKRNITISKVGTIAPDMARRKAEEYRALLLQGRDPLEEKQSARDRLNLSGLIDAYLASAAFTAKRASTQYVDIKRIDGHLRPLLGGLRVDEVTMGAVEKAFRSICEGRHAGKPGAADGTKSRVKGGEGIARSSIRLLRAILNWGYKAGAVEWEAVQAARNVQIGRDGRRDVILEDPAAYARLWAALRQRSLARGLVHDRRDQGPDRKGAKQICGQVAGARRMTGEELLAKLHDLENYDPRSDPRNLDYAVWTWERDQVLNAYRQLRDAVPPKPGPRGPMGPLAQEAYDRVMKSRS